MNLTDDSYDNFADFADDHGYCEHGMYVGGCGPDYLCGYCESGVSAAELKRAHDVSKLNKVRTQAEQVQALWNETLRKGVSGLNMLGIMERNFTADYSRGRYYPESHVYSLVCSYDRAVDAEIAASR